MQARLSGQVVRVLAMKPHPRWPNHKLVTVGAETFCHGEYRWYSGERRVVLDLGERATVMVAKDVFPFAQLGKTMDGALFCYYKARDTEPHALAA
jgi:hypothetical protein